MSRIGDANLFSAVFHAASESFARGIAPTLYVAPANGLSRATERRFLTNQHRQFDARLVDGCLVVRDTRSDKNRFSGSGPLGMGVGAGAVYFSRQNAAMLNEVRHYSKHKANVPKTLAKMGVIQLKVVAPLITLDLSRYSAHTAMFLNSLSQHPDVKSALQHSPLGAGIGLKQWLLHPSDYTVARAIGVAVGQNSHLDGVVSETARGSSRSLNESGDNIILYNSEGKIATTKATPEKVLLFDYNGKTREVTANSYDV